MGLAKKALVASILIGLFSVSFVLADVVLYNRNDYVKFVDSNVGITEAYTEYEICNPTLFDKVTDKRSLAGFDWEFDDVKSNLIDSWFEIKEYKMYEEKAYDTIKTCEPYYTPNETYIENCTTTFKEKTVEKWGYFWERFNPDKFNYKAGECYNIRIYGTYPVAYRENAIEIDNIISFAGYKFEEYAWWNGAWTYAYPITTSYAYNDHRYMLYLNDEDFDYAHAQTDGADLRILDGGCSNATSVEMDMWIENFTSTNSTIWFKGNNHTATDYCLYTGNAVATNVSSGTKTFPFFINNDTTAGWTTDAYTVSSDINYLTLTGDLSAAGSAYITFDNPYGVFAVDTFFKQTSTDNDDFCIQFISDGQYDKVFIRAIIPADDYVNFKWGWGATDSGVPWIESIDVNWLWIVNESDNTNGQNYILRTSSRATVSGGVYDVGGTNLAPSDANWFYAQDIGRGGTQCTFSYKHVILYPWESEVATLTLGAEIADVSIVLTTLRPDNITYSSASIVINGSTNVNGNTTWSEDGGANQTACNICQDFENTTTLAEGSHDIFVYTVSSTDAASTDSNQTFFTIDLTAPVVTGILPSGTYVANDSIPLNFTATDALSSVDDCWYSLNAGSNTTLASCANTTFSPVQAGMHNITIFANDTHGWEGDDSVSFIYDPYQNFTVNNSIDGAVVDEFQILISSASVYEATTNGSISLPFSSIGFGTLTLRITASGYNTTEFIETWTNETLLTENYTILPASTNITVYDETQAALGVYNNLTFNVTIANSTQSNTWYDQVNFFNYTSETPVGDVTVDISSYGYQSRRYYITINANIANTFTAYLLPTSDALYVRFNIRTIAEQAIEGALVTAERFIGSSWVTVGQRVSDEAGTAAIHLSPITSYRINASAVGYIEQYLTLTPSNTDYRIYLQSSTAAGVYETGLTNVSMIFTPVDLSLNATNISFSCWVTVTDSSLDYVAFNITNGTGTVLYTNMTVTTSGTRINTTIDFFGFNNSNATASCFFKRTGYDEFNVTRTYYIYNTDLGVFGSLASIGFTGLTMSIISAILTALTAGFVTRFGRNGIAGGFAGALVLGICTFYLGWFDWKAYILVITTLASLLVLRGGF